LGKKKKEKEQRGKMLDPYTNKMVSSAVGKKKSTTSS